ncbi:MAG: hypothetical protein K6F29_06980 [Bacteroidales bacterium]|nr:hypothetical protein [Bacteroidales bacterium]
MKRFVICLAAIGLIFSFNACKKDGVYNPSKKVSKIYTEVYLYDSVYNVIGSVPMLSQNFTWDKNILKEVDSYCEGEQDYKEIFVYDGKRLVRIDYVDPDYISEIEQQIIFSYEGSKLHKATFLDYGDIEEEVEYIYDKNKISEMIYTMYSGLSLNILEPLKQLLDPNMVEVLSLDKEMLACMEAKNGLTHKAGGRTMKIELEWEKDNISRLQVTNGSNRTSVAFTYDNKKNPFYSRPMEDIETMVGHEYGLLSVFCNKNNIVQMESTNPMGLTRTVSIEYEYDGSYPVKQTITPPHADPDDIVVKYIEYR